MTENTQTFATSPEQTPPPGPPPPGVVRSLRRSRSDRKVAGVAGGLGAYLGVDPVILRILFVVLAVFGGSGLLLYLAGWLLIPEEGAAHSEVQRFVDRNGTAALVLLGVVLAIVLIATSDALGWWGFGSGPWPLLVIVGIGVAVWYSARQKPSSPVGPVPTAPSPPAKPTEPLVPAPAAAPRRPASPLGLLTLSAAALTAGVLVALDLADLVSLPSIVLFAVLTAIVGLGLVVGSVIGRARWLIVPGLLLALVTAAVAATPTYANGQTGNTVWAPTSASSIASPYEWGAGDVVLDLSAVSPTTRTPVKAGLGAGTLTVVLPPTARAEVTGSVGAGTITMPDGSVSSGFGRDVRETLVGPSGSSGGGTLLLELNVGVGELRVRYATS